jgi:hypothetical protein
MIRWRKSKSAGKYLRLNLSRRGAGVSIGPRRGGPRLNLSPSGRTSASAGLPGTGLSASTRLDGRQRPTKGRSRQRKALARAWNDVNPAYMGEIRRMWADSPDSVLDLVTSDGDSGVDREVAKEFLQEMLGPPGSVT